MELYLFIQLTVAKQKLASAHFRNIDSAQVLTFNQVFYLSRTDMSDTIRAVLSQQLCKLVLNSATDPDNRDSATCRPPTTRHLLCVERRSKERTVEPNRPQSLKQ